MCAYILKARVRPHGDLQPPLSPHFSLTSRPPPTLLTPFSPPHRPVWPNFTRTAPVRLCIAEIVSHPYSTNIPCAAQTSVPPLFLRPPAPLSSPPTLIRCCCLHATLGYLMHGEFDVSGLTGADGVPFGGKQFL